MSNIIRVGAEFRGQQFQAGVSQAAQQTGMLRQEVYALGTVLDHAGNIAAGPVPQGLAATTVAANNTARAMGNMRKVSGTTNSALLSMGRIVQDAPYGLNAVANNIAFTVEQLGYLTAVAGGTTAALRTMWTALMGPVGIVLALNAGIAALQFWEMRAKKAKKATSELADEIEKITKRPGIADLLGFDLPEVGTVAFGKLQAFVALRKKQLEDELSDLRKTKSFTDVAAQDRAVQLAAEIDSYDQIGQKLSGNLAAINAETEAYNWLIENSKEFAASVAREKRITELLLKLEKDRVRQAKAREGMMTLMPIDEAADRMAQFQSDLRSRQLLGRAIVNTTRLQGDENLRTIPNLTEKLKELQAQNEETWKADNIKAYFGAAQMGAEMFGGSIEATLRRAGRSSAAFFKVWKSYAIAEATINTLNAFTNALAKIPAPFNIAAAGTILALGMAKVAAIAATQPGGRSRGGGSGVALASGGITGPYIGGTPVQSSATYRPYAMSNPVASGMSMQPTQVTGVLTGNGRDLVAVIDTTKMDEKRVNLER